MLNFYFILNRPVYKVIGFFLLHSFSILYIKCLVIISGHFYDINSSQHVQSLPTEKITKKPIPDEHLILKTTFEDLIQRCLSSATDPVCTFFSYYT
jgi:hypothetical protein